MIVLRSLVKGIDWLAEHTGKVVCWLAVMIALTMTFEVTVRYVFNNPTAWSYDTTIMMGGVLFLLMTPYVLLHRGHVRVDLFYARFSPRTRNVVDLVLTPLLLFGALGVFTQQAWKFAFWSLAVGEISQFGYWEPTMVPFRFTLAFGFSLLLLEAIAWFTRDLFSVITGKELVTSKETGGESHG